MKSTFLISMPALSLLATLAIPASAQEQSTQQQKSQPPRYTLTDLGTLKGGTSSQAFTVSDNGFVSGQAAAADGTQHAVLWYQGRIIDISKPGLLGPNSSAVSINQRGQAEVLAESTIKDPKGENFCAFGTGFKCLPFFWQGGVMTPLPLLGGNNGNVGQINNQGEVAGFAENGTVDMECPLEVSVSGTGPQFLDFEAVIWGPRQGQIRVLRPLPGDTVGMALSINDLGQAVGTSGRCGNTVLPPLALGPHAVIWEKDGSVHDLGNLGGAALNIGISINNHGQVTGFSGLTQESSPFNGTHAFLWTRETGKMQDLETLPGDVVAGGLSINERGDVVGPSFDADGNPRAFLWHHGVMTDLNALIPAGSPLFLLFAESINSRGEIVGFGATEAGDVHAFLATPNNGAFTSESFSPATRGVTSAMVLSEYARKLVQQRLPFGRFGYRPR
jgi:probable HAF family extracellular repeat protein